MDFQCLNHTLEEIRKSHLWPEWSGFQNVLLQEGISVNVPRTLSLSLSLSLSLTHTHAQTHRHTDTQTHRHTHTHTHTHTDTHLNACKYPHASCKLTMSFSQRAKHNRVETILCELSSAENSWLWLEQSKTYHSRVIRAAIFQSRTVAEKIPFVAGNPDYM